MLSLLVLYWQKWNSFCCIKRGQFDSNSLYIRLEKLFTQVYNDRLNLFIFSY